MIFITLIIIIVVVEWELSPRFDIVDENKLYLHYGKYPNRKYIRVV